MHILVLLEANFLNINNNDKQIPLQPTENAHTSKTAREMGSCWCSRMGRRGVMPHWEGLERAAQHDKPYPLGFYGMSLSYTGGVQVLSTNVCSSSLCSRHGNKSL